MTTNDGRHEHSWRPLTYFEGEGESLGEVALWACTGRTRYGKCLSTISAADMAAEERKRQDTEALERNEREQRHFKWED